MFRSCPRSFRLEQNVIPELLQIHFFEIYIYSGKHLFMVMLVGTDLTYILKQSLNIPLGKMKDMDQNKVIELIALNLSFYV